MGNRGPVPKRSSQRRRRNEPEGGPITTHASGSVDPEPPPADEEWHPIARAWYESLAASGQSHFYEPSDWATAVLMAESMSRDLNPQVVGITDSGQVVTERIPLKGASLSSYLKAMSVLLVTEGDRRRARLELTRPQAATGEEADVSELDDYRRRLRSS